MKNTGAWPSSPRWEESCPAHEYVQGWLTEEPDAEDLADPRAFAEALHALPDDNHWDEGDYYERPSVDDIEKYIRRYWLGE